MAIDKKYEHEHEAVLRDVRPLGTRVAHRMSQPSAAATTFIMAAGAIYVIPWATTFADIIMIFMTSRPPPHLR